MKFLCYSFIILKFSHFLFVVNEYDYKFLYMYIYTCIFDRRSIICSEYVDWPPNNS